MRKREGFAFTFKKAHLDMIAPIPIHRVETFYGDETLAGLLAHVGQYSETLSDFEEIYELADEEDLKENDDDEEYESESTEDTSGA